MSALFDRPFVRLALIGALAAAFALAGCGRKGTLDPPPAASVAGEQGKPATPTDSAKNQPLSKHFPLDPLLN